MAPLNVTFPVKLNSLLSRVIFGDDIVAEINSETHAKTSTECNFEVGEN